MSELHEYEVADARARTFALIAETEPVLHDLQHTLGAARDLLERLEEEQEDEGGGA